MYVSLLRQIEEAIRPIYITGQVPDGQNCYHNPFKQTRWESDRRAQTEVIIDGESTGKLACPMVKSFDDGVVSKICLTLVYYRPH